LELQELCPISAPDSDAVGTSVTAESKLTTAVSVRGERMGRIEKRKH
jgi:hypothetical protein